VKLHQLLAVAKTRRRDADGNVNGAYHIIQKHQLFVGMTRTYQPKDDAGLRLPEESQLVQANVADQLSTLRDALATLFDTQASIDVTNTFARADVVVDGVTLVERVPATHLLFVEKRLNDLHTVVSKLPTLDPTANWSRGGIDALWKTPPVETSRIEKKTVPVVVVPPTDKHPAQVRDKEELETVGTWTNVKLSGAVPELDKRHMLERISRLQQAVKAAREQANTVEVEELPTSALLDYVFGARPRASTQAPGA